MKNMKHFYLHACSLVKRVVLNLTKCQKYMKKMLIYCTEIHIKITWPAVFKNVTLVEVALHGTPFEMEVQFYIFHLNIRVLMFYFCMCYFCSITLRPLKWIFHCFSSVSYFVQIFRDHIFYSV